MVNYLSLTIKIVNSFSKNPRVGYQQSITLNIETNFMQTFLLDGINTKIFSAQSTYQLKLPRKVTSFTGRHAQVISLYWQDCVGSFYQTFI